MKPIKESGAGNLYEANGFLVPVVTGTAKEMGTQYGALMVDAMQQTWDLLVAPGRKSGAISDEELQKWSSRAHSTCSTRNRLWYDGVAEGAGWPIENVIMLDQVMEFGIFQSKVHSFAGCTSILSWGGHSSDGGMYIGRNMDLRLFNEDGSFAENGGCTKPTKQDADLTTHQMVADLKNRAVWLKVPVPGHFADWTEIDLQELWG